MEIAIEPAHSRDIPQLVELLDDLFGNELDFTANADRQRRGLQLLIDAASQSDRLYVAVARDGAGQAMAMASAQLVISTAEGALSAWVEDVIVHRDLRRQGVGRALLEHLLEWARARGATRAQLVADKENPHAALFFNGLQWETTNLVVRRRFIG